MGFVAAFARVIKNLRTYYLRFPTGRGGRKDPMGRFRMPGPTRRTVDRKADAWSQFEPVRAGAGADGLELAPRVGLPVDGAARGPGHAEPAHGVLPAAAARGEAQVICTKVLYDSRERSNKTHRDFASLHMPLTPIYVPIATIQHPPHASRAGPSGEMKTHLRRCVLSWLDPAHSRRSRRRAALVRTSTA